VLPHITTSSCARVRNADVASLAPRHVPTILVDLQPKQQ
jgi:hypothetical protein